MADRYWVGNSGSIGDSAHWSSTSGGPGGASIPTSADNVYFNANSFTLSSQTITMDVNLNCLNFDSTGVLNTPAWTTGKAINIYGSFKFISMNALSMGGSIHLLATSTGNTFYFGSNSTSTSVYFEGVGGEWTLTNQLSLTTGAIRVINGSFISGNKYIYCGSFYSNYTSTRSISLGSSILTVTVGAVDFSVTTGLTFDAGTSLIKLTSTASQQFKGGGLTYYNVELTKTGAVISGSNTFNELKCSLVTAQTVSFTAGTIQTVSLFTCIGTAGNVKTLQSTVLGSSWSISKASGSVTVSYTAIQDSTATGGATWHADDGTNTDLLGNLGWVGLINSISVTDTGHGAESISATLSLLLSDLGAGVDSIPILSANILATDTGSGNDSISSILAKIYSSDSGAGADSIPILSANINPTDAGHGNENITTNISLLIDTDTATFIDSIAIMANVTSSEDIGTGFDAIASLLADILANDSGIVDDNIAQLVVDISSVDSGSGLENIIAQTVISLGDSGIAIDNLNGFLVNIISSDLGTGIAERLSANVAISLSDVGSSLELASILSNITTGDFGNGMDLLTALLASIITSDSGDSIESLIIKIIGAALNKFYVTDRTTDFYVFQRIVDFIARRDGK